MQNSVEPSATNGLKCLQIGLVGKHIIRLRNQNIETPSKFSLISGFKCRSVPVLRASSLQDALKPQFGISDDGDGAIFIAPPIGKNGVLRRSTKTFNQHQSMVGEKFINAVAQSHGENIFTVLCSQVGCDLSEDMGCLVKAS